MLTAARLAGIKPSMTKAITQLARSMSEDGRSVIALSQGEPDFDTPAHVCAAAIAAIGEGHTRYTAVAGVAALRRAIVDTVRTAHGLDYHPDQVTVGCGAKQVIFNAFLASLDPDDEVIVPAPCWVSYPEMVALAGGHTVVVECPRERGFKLLPEALACAITPRTRWLVINSPNNPSGAVYTAAELAGLAVVLRRHPRVQILCDDIYDSIVYDGPATTMAAVAPDLAVRTLIVNGPSKSAAMTGWRVGYGVGPAALIAAMNLIQGQTSSHTSSISQHAAIQAIAGPQHYRDHFLAAYRERRDLVATRLTAVPGLSVTIPSGAFYLFIGCAELIGRRSTAGGVLCTDGDVAMYLLEEAGVALVPGKSFLMSPYLRLSFASAPEVLAEACDRIAKACGALG